MSAGFDASYIKFPVKETVAGGTQNLLLWSEELSRNEVPWETVNATLTANQGLDMDGQMTLESLSCGWSNAGVSQVCSVLASTTYRFSFEVRRGTATALSYAVFDESTYADLVVPTSYYASTSAGSTVRISVQFTTAVGCTSIRVCPLWGSSETGTVLLGRAQLETNGSSYVKSEGTIVTP